MPKKVFWPISLVIMGFVFLASNKGYLPTRFWNLWPVILIVVGLGGLLTSDRDEWLDEPKKVAKKSPSRKQKTTRKK